ncbi:MAG: elongation factor 1-beta [Candidatus Bathyarchaeia archaeon]|nr:elongation factor 1-beta [Candidatus Bathyarchaeota archaeon]
MARVMATIRVFPSSIDEDLNILVESINEKLPSDARLYTYRREPIAFGIEALILDILVPEETMGEVLDRVEEAIRSIEGVSEVEVILTRRV